MKEISWLNKNFSFKDNDSRLEQFRKLIDLNRTGQLDELDVSILSSALELHEELPPISTLLFEKGFTLPTNERQGANIETIWEDRRGNDLLRSLKYKEENWFTDYGRSDHYHIDVEYKTLKGVLAIHKFRNCETDYGQNKEYENSILIKKNDKVLYEYNE
jgi:hypothetical protein